MDSQRLAIFLLAYFLTGVVIAIASLFLNKSKAPHLLMVLAAAIGLVCSVVIGSLIATGENFLVTTVLNIAAMSRSDVLAFGFGGACAMPLALLWTNKSNKFLGFFGFSIALLGIVATLLLGGLSAGKEVLSPYFPHPETEITDGGVGSLSSEDFVVEDFIDTGIIPVRIAVAPNGKIFVSGHLGIAAQEGGVAEIIVEEDGTVSEKMVARMLNRPYGLLAENDRIFVSRSGQHTKWSHGKTEQISTGAVTLLQDLDDDGVMDYYHDIVTDLPGAKGPDYLHQNNDIAIGPDGALYVTTAHGSDGHPALDSMEGVVLRVTGENFENAETYATGLRNTFALEFNTEGELFATDNDPQSGPLGGNLGDKLVHVTKGAFFGHPFGAESDPDVSPHALRSKFALGGMSLATSENLPEIYRNSIFMVSYGEGRVMQVKFEKVDGEYKASLVPFAIVPGAIDIAAAPNGDFYLAVYPDKVVRIKLKQ